MKTRTTTLTCLLSLLVLGLTACGPDSAEPTVAASTESVSTTTFLLTDAPDSAPGLLAGLKAPSGDGTFLVSGRVGGVVQPISEDFAGFVLADEVLEFCDEMASKGHCPTPWDACCEDPQKIQSARAFVQFVDAAGDPVPVSLRDAIGLAENDTVIIRGKLSPDSTDENRIILAEGLAIVR
jgi:hypothetical protein